MAFPSGCGQATFNFDQVSSLGSTPAVVLGFDADGGDPADLGDALKGWAVDNLTDNMSSAYTLSTISIKTNDFEDLVVTNIVGGDTTAPASPATALLVRKSTGVPGRNQRGRSYWPGLLFDTQVDAGGGISGGTISLWQPIMQDLFDVFQTVFTTGGMALLASDGSASETVTTYTVQPVVATQRRRLRR